MIEIVKITEPAGIARLRPEWEGLWQRDPRATPFQSPAWLLAWWRCFGTPEPLLLAVRAGGELVGLLPLYLLREPGCRKLLPFGVGLSDYIDALVDPACPAAAQTLAAAIAETPGWDECWLPDLAPDGRLAGSAAVRGLNKRVAEAPACPVLVLPYDPVKLGEGVPRKTLRDLRQARRRATAAGGITTETVAADRLDTAIAELFRLHERRWRSRGESGVCADPVVRSFHHQAASALLAAGVLQLYRLSIGDKVAAVYYGFIAKGTAYAYLGGFDPSEPRLSPGTQIMAHAIEQAIAEGATRFDFLRGGEPYKYAWGAAGRRKISLHLSPRCATR